MVCLYISTLTCASIQEPHKSETFPIHNLMIVYDNAPLLTPQKHILNADQLPSSSEYKPIS